jgi:SAM-dependent methyltransferase
VVRRPRPSVPSLSYPERIIPDRESPGVVALHLKRYLFAAQYCTNGVVLDAGCGAGYGSAELARVARRVVGIDLDDGAVSYARSRYELGNVEFRRMDVSSLRFEDATFDVVVSFETIEHLVDRHAFLREVTRVLRPSGTFVVSTPNAPRTTDDPENPFHRVEYAPSDFTRLLSEHFWRVHLFGQRRLQTRRHRALQRLDVLGLRRRLPFLRRAGRIVGTAPTEGVSLEGIVIERDELDHATELVAVCAEPR